MKRRTLPGTTLEVSEVCLGTMTWGDQNSEAEAHEQLDLAVAHGINFIDTAEMYPGRPPARRRGGPAGLRGGGRAARGGGGRPPAPPGAGPGRRDWIRGGRTDLTRANIAEAVGASLERLAIDCIDLFQIHWPQRNVPMFGSTEFDPSLEKAGGPTMREHVEGMAAMIEAGRIRHWGVSNETAWGLCEFRRVARELGVPGPVTVQNAYSLVSRGADHGIAEVLYRESMSLLAYSPLAGGILTGKYSRGAKPAGARYTIFDTVGSRFREPIVHEAADAYADLARRRGLTPVQLALGYVRSRWYVGATIVGATSAAQLDEDIAGAQVELDAGTLADIAALQVRYPNPAP